MESILLLLGIWNRQLYIGYVSHGAWPWERLVLPLAVASSCLWCFVHFLVNILGDNDIIQALFMLFFLRVAVTLQTS